MYRIPMSENSGSGPRRPSPPTAGRKDRAERLAAALRANLKRRKQQARRRTERAGASARSAEVGSAPKRPVE